MSDPLDKATSRAPATLGEGCLSRYGPEALSGEDGTDFPDAARLWEQLQQASSNRLEAADGQSDTEAAHQLLQARSLLFQVGTGAKR